MMRFGKVALLSLVALLVALPTMAQIYKPVKWKMEQSDLGNNEYELSFTATIEDHWHLYSQNLPSEDGPVATFFDYKVADGLALSGKTTEHGDMVTEYDPNFDMELNYYEHTVTFKQKFTGTGTVTGEYGYMVCDAEKCLPPDYTEFSVSFGAGGDTGGMLDLGMGGETADSGDDHGSGIHDPVKWEITGSQASDNEYTLNFQAAIDEHWHLYSQHLESEDGPVATFFDFMELEGAELVGEVTEEGALLTEFDPNFDMELNYYETTVGFNQTVRLMGESGTVKGEYGFMVCDAEKCLPPKYIPFEFSIANGAVSVIAGDQPEEAVVPVSEEAAAGKFHTLREAIDLKNPASACGDAQTPAVNESSMWGIFALGFIGGLLALLTPCVFPMIPLTVTFFTKGSENRRKGLFRAIMYGSFIFLVYILLSIPFHLMDQLDPNILNSIGTNPWLNLFFFVIFIVFAISFFGYFEITLPTSWTNKTDSASDGGGLLGVFFMALTLALVSFSCTGPILGSLLVGSLTSDGGAWQLTAGMGGFGMALALPFALFAMFPGWLNSLPKSGGWLTSVKVVLGFAELALAVKFFSNADLVQHWNLMPIELFLALWIICGLGIVVYLFGKIKFPHDSPITKLSPIRIGLAVAMLGFVVYLASGYRYDERNQGFVSLTVLSGVAPPSTYSWIYGTECPLNLPCFKDYESGLAHAKATGKPIMIDFTGYACANCRRMEEQVWGQPGVYEKLKEDYVLISLYVDDRKALPEELQSIVTKTGERKIRTVGDKWAKLQEETFLANSQPLYCLISPDEELLNQPVGSTFDVQEYSDFLQCGLDAYDGINQLGDNSTAK